MVYPEDWLKSEGYMGTVVSFLCPDDPNGRTSLNLLGRLLAPIIIMSLIVEQQQTSLTPHPLPVQELPSNLSLQDYSNESLQQMQAMLGGSTFKVWNAELFGQEAKRMQFTTEMGPGCFIKVFQSWTVSNRRALIVTFSSPEEIHDNYREHVEKVLASMKFISPVDPKDKPIESLCLKTYENANRLFRIK